MTNPSEQAAATIAAEQQAAAKARIKELEQQNAMLQGRLESLEKSRWQFEKRTKARKPGKTFCRVVIPDTHGCIVDEAAFSAMLADLEVLRPAEVVWLGDAIDCGAWLATHHVLGYVAQTSYTVEQDIDAANQHLDSVQSLCPGATHHFIEGNHERRLHTFCVTSAMRNATDAAFLLRMFSAKSQLHLEKRGFNYYAQGEFYMGLSIPATIRLGHCYFTHGHSSAVHAAAKVLGKYGYNVVFGHIHRAQEHSSKTVKHGAIKAWCPGCLSQLQPLWRHTDPTEWTHGYAVQFVHGEDFLHVQIPIVNGVSYLVPFTEHLAK